VAATAARLLAPTGGRVIAYTGVPRAGYDGPSPPGRVRRASGSGQPYGTIMHEAH